MRYDSPYNRRRFAEKAGYLVPRQSAYQFEDLLLGRHRYNGPVSPAVERELHFERRSRFDFEALWAGIAAPDKAFIGKYDDWREYVQSGSELYESTLLRFVADRSILANLNNDERRALLKEASRVLTGRGYSRPVNAPQRRGEGKPLEREVAGERGTYPTAEEVFGE